MKGFHNVAAGAKQMLDLAKLQEFRENVAALENRAIFEIPEILASLLGEPANLSIPAGQHASLLQLSAKF